MVSRALDYIGDIMKYIKPLLVSKNQEGLQLMYWVVGRWKHFQKPLQHCSKGISNEWVCGCFWNGAGCIVKHWSPLLATVKAHQLLFRIVDGLLLPHNITQQDKALRDSLHLYLQVRSSILSLGWLEHRVGYGFRAEFLIIVFWNGFPCRGCRWLQACRSLRGATWSSSSTRSSAGIWTISFLLHPPWASSSTTQCFSAPVRSTPRPKGQRWGGPSWRCSGTSRQIMDDGLLHKEVNLTTL